MDQHVLDIANLYVAVASIVLAVLAITFSVMFYRWSAKTSRDAENAANNIAASVSKLETLFNLMYSDMSSMIKGAAAEHSSMIRESYQAMQRKVLEGLTTGEAEAERAIEERVAARVKELKEHLSADASTALSRSPSASSQTLDVRSQIDSAMTKAIEGVQRIEFETRQEVLQNSIKGLLVKQRNRTSVRSLLTELGHTFPKSRIVQELQKMGEANIIGIDPRPMTPNSLLSIV
jgi:hypothetical protein